VKKVEKKKFTDKQNKPEKQLHV